VTIAPTKQEEEEAAEKNCRRKQTPNTGILERPDGRREDVCAGPIFHSGHFEGLSEGGNDR
jgi:hypothetical protein